MTLSILVAKSLASISGSLATIPSPSRNSIHIGPLRLTAYGLLVATGVAVAFKIAMVRAEKRGMDPALVEKILVRMVLFGFLGARLAYVSTHLGSFSEEPWKVIAIWEGGLAIFGGLLVGAITLIWLCRRHGLSAPLLIDSVIPGLPIAQAIGRWGNYFNQELYGTPTDLPWGLVIDREPSPVHPTFLYESLWNIALAFVLFRIERKFPSIRGRLIALYLIGYSAMRFLLELIRTDTTFRFLGLSRNGWVSIGAMLLGLALLKWWHPSLPQAPEVDQSLISDAEKTTGAD